jgi:hypothetical protein
MNAQHIEVLEQKVAALVERGIAAANVGDKDTALACMAAILALLRDASEAEEIPLVPDPEVMEIAVKLQKVKNIIQRELGSDRPQ